MLTGIACRACSLSFLGLYRHTVGPTLAQFLVDTTGMPLLAELVLHAPPFHSEPAPFPERAQHLVCRLHMLDLQLYDSRGAQDGCTVSIPPKISGSHIPLSSHRTQELLTMLSRITLLEELVIQPYPMSTHSHLQATL